ncbi:hypothetical protein NDS46_31365 (plasmid) [Paenibacillus thiaminolyticus]|uniref:hypothetical protein n=1 Tax=Paenibacillus thiaminolyticus TaxID=49283 RepID=UPI00232E8087|nr:hypothetical protein [Paenibacillus thiaminolyticus]WCF11458.1 hypothetical protein NDS46_31365 [Paenibacillus thiaminolyticus]
MSSLLEKKIVLTGVGGKMIEFSRPYLNDEKELTFLSCSEFNQFSNLSFVLNESERALEIRKKNGKRILVLLERFVYEKALGVKFEIVERIKKLMQVLQAGSEEIYIFETGKEECPFYFTSKILIDNCQYSIKFEKAMLYYVNQKREKEGATLFTDFMEMQKVLSRNFRNNKESICFAINVEKHYETTFSELLKIA